MYLEAASATVFDLGRKTYSSESVVNLLLVVVAN
jgi:hypothetical protein